MKQAHELDIRRIVGPGPSGRAPASDGGIQTDCGWFSHEELAATLAVVIPDGEGGQIVHFPVAYEADGPVYAPLGIDGHAKRLDIARAYAASEERRKRDRERARGVEVPTQRRRRWEDE